MVAVVDTNHDVTPHLSALKAAGVRTVIRYINPGNVSEEKTVKEPEARAIAAAGLRLGLVCEGWGDFAHNAISYAKGASDGSFCRTYARTVGAPKGAIIWFAVDADASAAQIKNLVIPYFTAIRAATINLAAMGVTYRVGVYGSGAVCSAVMESKTADASWLSCSLGWSGSREAVGAEKWTLRQHVPAVIAGIDTDPNDTITPGADIGDFVPFAPTPERTSPGGILADIASVFTRSD